MSTASTYPTALDEFLSIAANPYMDDPTRPATDVIAELQNAIAAVQASLGVTGALNYLRATGGVAQTVSGLKRFEQPLELMGSTGMRRNVENSFLGITGSNTYAGSARSEWIGKEHPTQANWMQTYASTVRFLNLLGVQQLLLTDDLRVVAGNGQPSAGAQLTSIGAVSAIKNSGNNYGFSFGAWAEQGGNNRRSSIAFMPTFGTGVPDTIPRRGADVVAGFVGGWDSAFLDLCVNGSTNNDGFNETPTRVRVTRTGAGFGGTLSPACSIDTNGHAKLGATDVPRRSHYITGTTSFTVGTPTNIAHGLDLAKILYYELLIQTGDSAGFTTQHTNNVTHRVDSTNFSITPQASSTAGKAFRCSIWYRD